MHLQVAWDVKGQLQALRRSRRHRDWLRLANPLVDVRIAAWLQTPDDSATDPAVGNCAGMRPASVQCPAAASWTQAQVARAVDHTYHVLQYVMMYSCRSFDIVVAFLIFVTNYTVNCVVAAGRQHEAGPPEEAAQPGLAGAGEARAGARRGGDRGAGGPLAGALRCCVGMPCVAARSAPRVLPASQ
jgi:hypothetical protein